MRLWIGLALIAICAGVNLAQSDEYDWYGLDDSNFQSQEYEYQVSAENKDDNLNLVEEKPEGGNENIDQVDEDIENFYKSLENEEDKPDESVLNDYQFEDNRSEPKDEQDIPVEQQDALGAPVHDENNGLNEKIEADYNDGPLFDMDKNKSTLIKNIPQAEEDNENQPLETVDDILNKVFDDAEIEKNIQENIESIEQTNQLVNDLADGITSSEKTSPESVGEKEAEMATKHQVQAMESSEDFKEIQKFISQDSVVGNLDEDSIMSHENDEYQSVDETEVDDKELFGEKNQSDEQDQVQNEALNNEEQIFEEKINKEGDDDNKEEISNAFEGYAEENPESNNEVKNLETNEPHDENIDEEDTYDKAYADLNDDLKQLFETWDKLQEDDSVKEDEDGKILDYEEKYNKPYRENNILSVRENDDGNDDSSDEDKDINEEELDTKQYDETNEQYNTLVLNATIVLESKEVENLIGNDDAFYRNSSMLSVPEPPTDKKDTDVIKKSPLITLESGETKIAEVQTTEDKNQNTIEAMTDYDIGHSTGKAIAVDDLSPNQYDDLMKQFSIVHSDELEIKSGDNVAPIHMTISADEAIVIESPDYPNNYPTNNVIDYYFDGLGTGIEFNITDFSVNGILGDYLLVKPGGIDASGNDGLVFSYHLNEKRQYRFLNVDRLFVRFFAHPGNAMFKGYQFSVKMISPPEEKAETEPEPEPLLPPLSTHTVTLGGTSLEEFSDIEEDFRLIIADMATMYINANDIDSGLNLTTYTTQITKTSLCNVNWPNFESCVSVTFGVPLLYDDGRPPRLNEADLRSMWENYVWRDPFAARLRRLGITEFDFPNDRRVLTVWLVIAAGVVISMAMLAFALWRFSCFEDYTRMPAYSDTDSINDKRVLDMYPTPHQTFPALYSEQQLKWDDDKFDDTTRVDMGGFANRSYVRNDELDMDSDEDVVTTPRDRNSFSPRDIYQV